MINLVFTYVGCVNLTHILVFVASVCMSRLALLPSNPKTHVGTIAVWVLLVAKIRLALKCRTLGESFSISDACIKNLREVK